MIEIRAVFVRRGDVTKLLSGKGHQGTFREDGNVLYFHLGDGYTGQNTSNDTLNIYELSHIYTSIVRQYGIFSFTAFIQICHLMFVIFPY